MMTAIQFVEDAPNHNVRVLATQRARMALQALIAEVELTPKPGLVDRRGSGAHADLSLDRMRRSAASIEPYFAMMAAAAHGAPLDCSLREELAAIGRDAETAMMRATAGSNAHKGAIWVIGLLLSAHSMHGARDAHEIAGIAGTIAALPDRARPQAVSHGQVVLQRYGATGARGEACAGFPHVTQVGLPALRQARANGCSETTSRLCAFLQIATQLEDTCVLHRGGSEGLAVIQRGARTVMQLGGPGTEAGRTALHILDRECVTRRLSPGGSADLLAATLLLDAIERGQHAIQADASLTEELYGTHAI